MYAASREALAQTRSALSSALGAVSAGAATAASAQAGSELFSVVEVLDGQRALRSALADASAPAAGRQALAEQLFSGKVGAEALATVKAAAGQDWSAARDLVNSLELLGREALLRAAADQSQLDTVEDELFRLGRIVQGIPAWSRRSRICRFPQPASVSSSPACSTARSPRSPSTRRTGCRPVEVCTRRHFRSAVESCRSAARYHRCSRSQRLGVELGAVGSLGEHSYPHLREAGSSARRGRSRTPQRLGRPGGRRGYRRQRSGSTRSTAEEPQVVLQPNTYSRSFRRPDTESRKTWRS